MAARDAIRLVLLGLGVLVAVQACGVLPYTGPPDASGTYYTNSHGRP